jgi:hypothetical protein
MDPKQHNREVRDRDHDKAANEIDVVRLTNSGLAVCNYANLSLTIQQFDKLQLYNEIDHFSDGVQTWHLRALVQEFPFLAQLDLSDESDFDKDSDFDGDPFEIWFARQCLKIGKGGYIVHVAVPTNTEMWHHDAYFYGDSLKEALDKACDWQERGAPRNVTRL